MSWASHVVAQLEHHVLRDVTLAELIEHPLRIAFEGFAPGIERERDDMHAPHLPIMHLFSTDLHSGILLLGDHHRRLLQECIGWECGPFACLLIFVFVLS